VSRCTAARPVSMCDALECGDGSPSLAPPSACMPELGTRRALSGALTIPGLRDPLEVCVFYILYRLLLLCGPARCGGMWGQAVRYNGTKDYSERLCGRGLLGPAGLAPCPTFPSRLDRCHRPSYYYSERFSQDC
jgi:hypothetical protein